MKSGLSVIHNVKVLKPPNSSETFGNLSNFRHCRNHYAQACSYDSTWPNEPFCSVICLRDIHLKYQSLTCCRPPTGLMSFRTPHGSKRSRQILNFNAWIDWIRSNSFCRFLSIVLSVRQLCQCHSKSQHTARVSAWTLRSPVFIIHGTHDAEASKLGKKTQTAIKSFWLLTFVLDKASVAISCPFLTDDGVKHLQRQILLNTFDSWLYSTTSHIASPSEKQIQCAFATKLSHNSIIFDFQWRRV